MSKNKSYKILKIRDKNDDYYKEHPLFDMPFRLLINGKSQLSGKTTLILNILLNPDFGYSGMFEGENIFIVSNNKLDNKLSIMADKLEIPEDNRIQFDPEHIEMIYEDMEDEFQEAVADGMKPDHKLIVFDDCAYSGGLKSYSKGNIIDRLICNGRHSLVSQIYTSQKYSQCSTCLRTNLTGAILFGTNSKEVEMITSDMSHMKSNKEFMDMFRTITKKRRSFFVVNWSNPPDTMYLDSEFKPIKWE